MPLVSAVIPTRNRPQLVVNAVRSVLAQTYADVEAVVVIDGPPDPATEQALAEVADRRLRVIPLPAHGGGSAARNAGVASASGEWIAFLDDDDEWLRKKIAVQLEIAKSSGASYPIVASRFIARAPEAEHIWPRQTLKRNADVGDYLFARSSLFQGEAYLATPTLFAKRELLLQLPWRCDLKKHEDWDWLVRAARHEGVAFEFVAEPLVIVRVGPRRAAVSNVDDWRFSLNWIKDHREYVSAHAYAAFILTVVADQAARQATLPQYLDLYAEAWRGGQPDLLHLLLYAGMRVFPRDTRHQLRRIFKSRV